MPSFITLGAQGGGPETMPVGQTKVLLYLAFEKHLTGTHCDAIDEYAPVLRVGGSLDDFGPEGLSRLRFAKKSRYITIDIDFPQDCWKPLGEQALKQYLSRWVRAALEACVARLRGDGHHVDELSLWNEVDVAISEYLGSPISAD